MRAESTAIEFEALDLTIEAPGEFVAYRRVAPISQTAVELFGMPEEEMAALFERQGIYLDLFSADPLFEIILTGDETADSDARFTYADLSDEELLEIGAQIGAQYAQTEGDGRQLTGHSPLRLPPPADEIHRAGRRRGRRFPSGRGSTLGASTGAPSVLS